MFANCQEPFRHGNWLESGGRAGNMRPTILGSQFVWIDTADRTRSSVEDERRSICLSGFERLNPNPYPSQL
jgi:hypothetical protein